MTGDDFTAWLAAMRSAGIAPRQLDAAALLQISVQTIATMKRSGTDHRTALACAALLHRLPPYAAAAQLQDPGTDTAHTSAPLDAADTTRNVARPVADAKPRKDKP